MSQIETLTKELDEAKAELVEVDKKYHRLEFHRKHLHEIIKDRKKKLSELRKDTLAPVTVTLYKRDGYDIIERNSTDYNRVSEAAEIDFSQHDYMTMGVSCGHIEDTTKAIYSMDMGKLPQPIAEGNVVLISRRGWNAQTDYISGILNSPTHFYALQEFQRSMAHTKDFHHQFLEGLHEIEVPQKLRDKYGEDVRFFEFLTGS